MSMSLQIPEFIWNKNQWRESLDTWVTWRGHPRCGVRQRNREQDADHYNYLRSQSVIISSTSFFSLPKSECAAVLLCPRPRPPPPSSLSPQLVKTHQSLVWGGDSRDNLSKLARIVSSSSTPNRFP